MSPCMRRLTRIVGSWPIKVGSKTVEQQVMLVEQAFFPVVLGRSFMEKRQVRFDPLDQTAVLFQVRCASISGQLMLVGH